MLPTTNSGANAAKKKKKKPKKKKTVSQKSESNNDYDDDNDDDDDLEVDEDILDNVENIQTTNSAGNNQMSTIFLYFILKIYYFTFFF